jgi:hypothetical protein
MILIKKPSQMNVNCVITVVFLSFAAPSQLHALSSLPSARSSLVIVAAYRMFVQPCFVIVSSDASLAGRSHKLAVLSLVNAESSRLFVQLSHPSVESNRVHV